ncbi:MAG: DUF1501 domain-containing protein [Planctomycetota bacterium]|nr:MAG: DUF1501 domain-containing protein [Planctomycetota bacterium]
MPLTRRSFLGASGGAALSCCLPVQHWPRLAPHAPSTAEGKVLVVLFLRGGVDGLNFIVPYGDPHYRPLREGLAIRRPGEAQGALDLDGFFGLHPAAGALQPFFASGQAVAIHAVGHAQNSRSHFTEQDLWETGTLDNTLRTDGWLNRHLASRPGPGPIRAVAIGDGLPRILRGDAEAIAIRGLSDLSLGGSSGPAVLAALERAYGGRAEEASSALLGRSGRATLEALRELQSVANAPYSSAVEYPDTSLGRRLREIARLVKADIGLEIAAVDLGGWDTHQNQGSSGGTFGALVAQVAGAVAALARDLEHRMDDVLVLTISEFGRTAAQNGTGGTDHGWGNCLLALGGPVHAAGGGTARNVLGRWPGLAPEELHQGRDLEQTTDFRDVFAEVARVHLGSPAVESLFPGRVFERVGLV